MKVSNNNLQVALSITFGLAIAIVYGLGCDI